MVFWLFIKSFRSFYMFTVCYNLYSIYRDHIQAFSHQQLTQIEEIVHQADRLAA